MDGFDDDDRVVHHRTDGEHQCEEGQQVDREARERKEGERTDQRYEDRDGRNQRRAYILQEDINHQYDEDDGLDQGLDYFVDRSVQVVVDAHQRTDFDAFGQILADLGEQCVDLLYGLRGVRTCGLEDERRNAGIAVDKAVISVGLLSQFDVGHVFQTQYLTVGSGSNHDLSELFGSHFTATILHGILERIVGVLAERTGCRFDVLFRQDGRNIRRDQFILGHYVRFHPDTHRIVRSQDDELTHALNTEYLGLDIDVHIVGEERLVVGTVGAAKGEDFQHRRLALHGRHTDFGNLGRERSGCRRYFVLHIDGGHVRIGALFEIDRDRSATGVRCFGFDVHHVLHAVDSLLERNDDALLDGFGAGARIAGTHHHRRGRDVGVLLDR